jgi:hypothetical protein
MTHSQTFLSAISISQRISIRDFLVGTLGCLFSPGVRQSMNFLVAVTILGMVDAPMLSCIAPCDYIISMHLSFTPAGVVKSGCSTVKATPPQCSCHRLRYWRSRVRLQGAVPLGNERGIQRPNMSYLILVSSSSFLLDPPRACLLGIPL